MRPRPSGATVALVVSLCFLAVAACTGGSDNRLIPPPPSTVALATTGPDDTADFTGVALAPVEGRPPAEKVEILGGEATLTGIVTGPDGPVAGAIVRLERFVGDATAKLDVVTGGDGTWRAPQAAAPPTVPTFSTAPLQPGQVPTVPPPTAAPPPPPKPTGPQGIFGGRYRVRAWRTPDLALTTPQILFVESTQNRNVGLQLSRYTGVSASSIYSPDPPLVGGSTSVTAVVTTLSVDGDGVVRSVPLANASISVSVDPPWLFSGGQLITNGQGRATFQLQCEAEGQGRVDLIVNSTHSFGLTFRPCVPPAPSTTTSLPDASTTSSILGGTTSTTFGSTPTTR